MFCASRSLETPKLANQPPHYHNLPVPRRAKLSRAPSDSAQPNMASPGPLDPVQTYAEALQLGPDAIATRVRSDAKWGTQAIWCAVVRNDLETTRRLLEAGVTATWESSRNTKSGR